jgi:hypothetical protein
MIIPNGRKLLFSSCVFVLLAALGTGLFRVAAKSTTEAPAGFNTPSFNGAHSLMHYGSSARARWSNGGANLAATSIPSRMRRIREGLQTFTCKERSRCLLNLAAG